VIQHVRQNWLEARGVLTAEARDIVHLLNRSLLFEISNHITPSFNSVDSLSEHPPPHPSKF
jgi:hypothetical protein